MKSFSSKRESIENEYIYLDGENNVFHSKLNGKWIKLTEKQYRFLLIVLKGKGEQREVTEFLWGGGCNNVRTSNYHQIIYQCRKALECIDIPRSFIFTIPNHGVRINYHSLIKTKAKNQ